MATRRIINMTGLAKMVGRNVTRISRFIREGRLKGDYIDNEGFHYWTHASAEKIAKIIKDYEAQGKTGRGHSIQFEPEGEKDNKEG